MCKSGIADPPTSVKGKEMADIKPIKGFRYKLEHASDLDNVTAPPYDMLDSEMVNDLYNKNPFNTVRVTQNRPEPQDTCNKDRHERAAQFFNEWVSKGIIFQDEKPSVYVYKQRFSFASGDTGEMFERTGVIVQVKLVDFEEGIVLPHEKTLSGPKTDRYELLDATRVNTGQIFGLISDEGDFFAIVKSMISNTPVGVFKDVTGVEHELYRCSDAALISKLISTASDRTILIADGHHRYETALKYYRNTGNEAYAYTMMTLVSMADPGLVIRPFHRLICKTEVKVDFLQSLPDYFVMKKVNVSGVAAVTDFLAGTIDAEMLYFDSKTKDYYALTISSKGEAFLKTIFPEQSDIWKGLSVSRINTIIINTIMNLPLDGKVLHDVVEYVNDPVLGCTKLEDSDHYHGGFFIRPLHIQAIQDIVTGGERMPQKSTNFYPKLFSGLVFNSLEQQ